MNEIPHKSLKKKDLNVLKNENTTPTLDILKQSISNRLKTIGITKEDFQNILRQEEKYSSKAAESDRKVNVKRAWMDLPIFLERHPDLKLSLQKHPVIELGVGTASTYVAMAETFRKKFGVEHYIGVDKYALEDHSGDIIYKLYKNLNKNTSTTSHEAFREGRYPKITESVSGDMLEFLLRLPDNYGNIVMGNIDDFVISDSKYANLLKKEITRVIPKGGLFIKFEGCSFIDFEAFQEIPIDFVCIDTDIFEREEKEMDDYDPLRVFVKK